MQQQLCIQHQQMLQRSQTRLARHSLTVTITLLTVVYILDLERYTHFTNVSEQSKMGEKHGFGEGLCTYPLLLSRHLQLSLLHLHIRLCHEVRFNNQSK